MNITPFEQAFNGGGRRLGIMSSAGNRAMTNPERGVFPSVPPNAGRVPLITGDEGGTG